MRLYTGLSNLSLKEPRRAYLEAGRANWQRTRRGSDPLPMAGTLDMNRVWCEALW